jgi:N-acetylmuramoyl-L-alanine amidase
MDCHRRAAASVGVLLMIGLFLLAAAVAPRADGAGDGADAPDRNGAPRHDPPKHDSSKHDTSARSGCRPETFKIALDVGHTPEAPGATSARGVKEHVFNLQLARRIQKMLADGGFVRASLIAVHGFGHFQLMRRTAQADASGADLLLSIHHDDVQDIYHQTWTHDGAPHAYSDRFSGYSLFVSVDNRHFDDSLTFAKLLGTELAGHGLHYSGHHAEPIRGEGRLLVDDKVGVYRYDGLFVLRSSAAPAVLMEAGIIVNRRDELVLASPGGQDRIGAAVLGAVNAFCR